MRMRLFRGREVTVLSTLAILLMALPSAQALTGMEHWVPPGQRVAARTLVDPGPSKLVGGLSFTKLDLSGFLVTFDGAAGRTVLQVLPAGTGTGKAMAWSGKRVAIRVMNSTLAEAAMSRFITAFSALLGQREHRWNWSWRTKSAGGEGLMPHRAFRRNVALVGHDLFMRAAEGLDRADPQVVLSALDAVDVAYRVGQGDIARQWASELRITAQQALGWAQNAKAIQRGPRLRLARALASAKDLKRLKVVQKTLLGSGDPCDMAPIARALWISGNDVQTQNLLEKGILSASPDCSEALLIATDLHLARGNTAAAEALLKPTPGRQNKGLFYLAKAHVALAKGDRKAALRLLNIALRTGRRSMRIVDLLSALVLLNPPEIMDLSYAKDQMELHPGQLVTQLYGGLLCAAHRDMFCVSKALRRVGKHPAGTAGPGVRFLRLFDAQLRGQTEVARRGLDELWRSRESLLTPMVLEARLEGPDEAVDAGYLRAYVSSHLVAPVAEGLLGPHTVTQPSAQASTDAPPGIRQASAPVAAARTIDPPSTECATDVAFMWFGLLAVLGALALFVRRRKRKASPTPSP